MTKAGFTGTRAGMTPEQKTVVNRLLSSYEELHHGDCIGADSEAHTMFNSHCTCHWSNVLYWELSERVIKGCPIHDETKVHTVVHPPSDPKLRAYCTGEIREPKDYKARDRDIVNETDVLIATPRGKETRRSGTWYTVRYAKRRKKPVIIVWPDGSITTS